MDDLTIGSGTSGVDSSGTSSTPSMTPLSSSSPTDTLSNASNPDSVFYNLTHSLTLNQYINLMHTTATEVRVQLGEQAVQDPTRLKGMRLNSILTAMDLANLQTQMVQLAGGMQQVFNDEVAAYGSMNSGISAYNAALVSIQASDQTQINLINQAIVDFNNGDISQATYDAAVAQYSQYVDVTRPGLIAAASSAYSSAASAYSSAAGDINSSVTDINQQFTDAGLPPPLTPISTNAPTAPTPPSMPASPPSSSPTPLPNAPTASSITPLSLPTPPPTADDLVNTYLVPLQNAVLPALQETTKFFDKIDEHQEFVRDYLGPLLGRVDYQPSSYIDPKAQAFIDSSAEIGSGAGASMATLIAGLDSRALNRLLSTGLATESAIQAKLYIPPRVLEQLRLINLTLLQRVGITSGPLSLELLGEKLPPLDANPAAIGVTLGTAFLEQVQGLTANTNEIRQTLLDSLVAANPDADASQIAKLVDTLIAQSNAFQLLTGLGVFGTLLGSQQLTQLVLGTLDDPSIKAALQESQNPTLAGVLTTPISNAYLKAELAATLKGYGVLSDAATQQVIKDLDLSKIKDEEQLKTSIREQLVSKGIADDQAKSLADVASTYTQAETLGKGKLDSEVRPETVQQDYLKNQLQQQGVSPNTATNISQTLASSPTPFPTIRAQRDAIADLLQKAPDTELTPLQAYTLATNIALGPQPGTSPATLAVPNDLTTIITTPPPSTEVQAAIASQIQDTLTSSGVDPLKAQSIASDSTSAIFTAAQQIQDQVRVLDRVSTDRTQDLIARFITPTTEQTSYYQKLVDPGSQTSLAIYDVVKNSKTIRHTGWLDVPA